jgi:hypothetical protein
MTQTTTAQTTDAQAHTVYTANAQPVEVTPEQRFLFDSQGFLLLKNAIHPADLALLLQATQQAEKREHDDSRWRKQRPDGRIGQETKQVQQGWVRLNGLLRIDPVFDLLIDYPTVFPFLQEFMGDPQLGNTWSISKSLGNDTGSWHRGIGPEHYAFRNGQIRSRMLNTVYFLTDNGPDDGCMLGIPGAHKSNIDLPWVKYKGLDMPGSIRLTGNAGDVLIFSEALLHNGLGNTTGNMRTNLYANYVSREYNVMMHSPEHNFHFCMPESIRRRFTANRRRATMWMEQALAIE